MKSQLKRILAGIFAGLMLLPAVSCSTANDPSGETKDPDATDTVTEDDTGYKPDIAKKDYDSEFVMMGTGSVYHCAAASEDSAGDPFSDSIYERSIRVQEYLGVELIRLPEMGGTSYAEAVIRTVQSGDDEYQLVTAPRHVGINSLIISGGMFDFAALDSVDLDAPYWSRSLMEEYLVGEAYLIGYNDFCLANSSCLVFNKDLMAKYNLKEPYDDVHNMNWTMDTMISLVSDVSEDSNGDGVLNESDVYGLTGDGWGDYLSLNMACGIKVAARDSDGVYHVAYNDNPERMQAYLQKVDELLKAEFAYFGRYGTGTTGYEASFGSGHALICMKLTDELMAMRDSQIRFGILPFPMFDKHQGEYYSLNWNGMLMIPGTIQNTDMVGDVLEMLAYYTAPVKTAFYEDLLGSKLSEAPEDAAMLDIIWNSQSSDVSLVVADLNAQVWVELLYLVPTLATEGVDQYASFMRQREKAANKIIDRLFNPKNRR